LRRAGRVTQRDGKRLAARAMLAGMVRGVQEEARSSRFDQARILGWHA
jgi:hypothetical protein